MVNIQALKGAMVGAGYDTLEDAAKAIGMNPTTMYRRVKDENFRLKEVHEMIKVFGIKNADEIFLPLKETKCFSSKGEKKE